MSYVLMLRVFLLMICLSLALPTLGQVGDFGPYSTQPNPFTKNVQESESESQFDKKVEESKPEKHFDPNDSDNSPEMQIAWKEWDKRVAAAISQRFSTMANQAFRNPSETLKAVACYTVTRNGRIINAHLVQKSLSHPIFNAIVLTAINSLNSNTELLHFPEGAKKEEVEQSQTFLIGGDKRIILRDDVPDREHLRLQLQ